MITAREIAYGIYGAYRLARLDAGAMAWFNISIEGFWRSFFAAAVAAPGYACLIVLHLMEGPGPEMLEAAGGLRVFLIETLAYAIGWLAYPLAMYTVSGLLDRREEYIGFIVAYNWAGVIQIAVFLPVVAINVSGLIPQAGAAFLALIVTLAVFFYLWFIARTALKLTVIPAIIVVGLDVVLAIVISGIANAMLYGLEAA